MNALATDKVAGLGRSLDGDLDVRLDSELPARLEVGAGTILFVSGSCFHRDRRVESITIVAGGAKVTPIAQRMPRLDLLKGLHPAVDVFSADGTDHDSDDDPLLRSYRSGFWAMVPLGPASGPETVELRVEARLDDGETTVAEIGRIEIEPGLPSDAAVGSNGGPAGEPLVAICMATFEPPADLFERQIESIRAQTHRNWVCLISDDRSSPGRYAEIERLVGDDPRFVISRGPARLGHYANFERALSMVPAHASYVTLCDQDDRWYPERIATLISELAGAQLVYSDARIVDRDGNVLSETFWNKRRNNHTNLISLLISNTVTGAASLFRRELVDLALPFPPPLGSPFHDNWLGLVALATGEVNFVERPLWDYVQHREAAIGHAGSNVRIGGGRGGRGSLGRLRWLAKNPHRAFVGARVMYFQGYCRLVQWAMIMRLRYSGRMSWRKRRAIDGFLAGARSPRGIVSLAARRLRTLVGRNETLGVEGALARALIWRYAVSSFARGRDLPRRGVPNDASLPGREREPGGLDPFTHPSAKMLRDRLIPLSLDVRSDAPERVNFLIPLIDLRHFFGGYITKVNLARRLAERGLRVRLVTVDPTPPLPRNWERQIESYNGLEGTFDHVEVAFGREGGELEVNPRDRFIATTWWTAHNARAALSELEPERFLYLIQEYEPFTFPMGAVSAIADQTYSFPHYALFSSELLRDFFRRRGLGVFAAGGEAGERDSLSFQNAITAVEPPTDEELRGRTTRRLLFYARPEIHAVRNMFELGVLSLAEAVSNGTLGPEWELSGIGTVEHTEPIALASGAALRMVPRTRQNRYAELLRTQDVGLALMYTPHPSLVPMEMASAGMLTVTNSFENKTPEAMRAISENLIVADPTIDGTVAALAEAVAAVGDIDRRVRGARVDWSRAWDSSYDEAVMDRVTAFLRDS